MTNKLRKTNKKNKTSTVNNQVNQLTREIAKLKVSNKTPFADVGSHLGNMVGFKDIGKAAGGFIGRILGSGDYTTNFSDVSTTRLTSSVPAFGGESIVVTKREYIQDVISGATGAFKLDSFTINPGLPSTFPWLATIAQNFEEYEIKGMVFEFKTNSGNTTAANQGLGSVILATQYDPTKPVYSSKQDMENYFFAQSTVPSQSVMHAVECKREITPVKSLYVRNGAVDPNEDLRWTDFGKFSIASVGIPAATVNLGELWVSYDIILRKPKLPATFGGSIYSFFIERFTVAPASPLGTTAVRTTGYTLGITSISSTSVSFTIQPSTFYKLEVVWVGGAAVTVFPSVTASSTFTAVNVYAGSSTNQVLSNNSTSMTYTAVLTSNVTVPNSVGTFTFGTAGVYPTACNVDITITELDDSLFG